MERLARDGDGDHGSKVIVGTMVRGFKSRGEFGVRTDHEMPRGMCLFSGSRGVIIYLINHSITL